MLKATNIHFDINNQTLLENVDLSLDKGQLKILFGSSGTGKTTIIRMLAGFITPDEGKVTLDERSIKSMESQMWRRQVVLLHQEPRMFPGTVKDNLTFAPEHHGLDIEPHKLMNRCHLEVDLNQEANTLSGGEKQRLALARALSVKPRFLLLDEPTSSLHEDARQSIDDLIKELVNDNDLGVLFVTHNPSEVKELGKTGYCVRDKHLVDLKSEHLSSLKQS